MANELIDPRRPNWTIPPSSSESLRAGSNLPATRPYQPNFTMPGSTPGTGARQPFDVEAPGKAVPNAPAITDAKMVGPSAGRRVLGAAGSTLRQAGPAMLMAGTAAYTNQARQRELDNAPVMPAPGEAAPGQIPVDTRYAAPPANAGSLLSQDEAGRNFGNALMATPMGTGLSAGLRGAANLFQIAKPAATFVKSATGFAPAVRGYAAGDAANPGVSSKAPVLGPTPSIREPFSDVRNGTYGDGMPDLTGKIVRDGNSYSGKDVKFGAEIVNPRNPGVGVSSLDTSEGYRQNLLELQRNAASAQAPGGAAGIGPRGGGNVFDDLRAKSNAQGGGALERAMREASPRGRLRLAEVMNANAEAAQTRGLQGEIAAAQTGATIRGQDITAGTSRANTRDTVGASLRGQDMDYAEKMDSKRMDIAVREAQRRAIASAWQGTTDPQVAAARLASSGYDPTAALAVAGGQRASADASATALDRNLAPLATGVDKDGKGYIDPAKLAQARKTAQGVAPGYATAAPGEQIANQPRGLGPTAALTGMNTLRGDSLMNRIFPSGTPPEMTTLPDLNGAQYAPMGFTDVAPWSKRSVGDMGVRLRDGTMQYIPKALANEDVIDTLKRSGTTPRN